MKAGVRTHECNFALGSFFLEGHFDLKMVVDLRVRSENGNRFGGDSYVLSVLKMGRKNHTSCSHDG